MIGAVVLYFPTNHQIGVRFPAREVLLFSSNLLITGCGYFNIYFMVMAAVVSSTTTEQSQFIIYIETPTGYKLLIIQDSSIKNLIFKNKVFGGIPPIHDFIKKLLSSKMSILLGTVCQ